MNVNWVETLTLQNITKNMENNKELLYSCSRGTYPCVLKLTFKFRLALQGHLLFVDRFNEINCFKFPLMLTLKFLLCTCCFNILDSCVEICITGELRSVINIRLDDSGHSSYQNS